MGYREDYEALKARSLELERELREVRERLESVGRERDALQEQVQRLEADADSRHDRPLSAATDSKRRSLLDKLGFGKSKASAGSGRRSLLDQLGFDKESKEQFLWLGGVVAVMAIIGAVAHFSLFSPESRKPREEASPAEEKPEPIPDLELRKVRGCLDTADVPLWRFYASYRQLEPRRGWRAPYLGFFYSQECSILEVDPAGALADLKPLVDSYAAAVKELSGLVYKALDYYRNEDYRDDDFAAEKPLRQAIQSAWARFWSASKKLREAFLPRYNAMLVRRVAAAAKGDEWDLRRAQSKASLRRFMDRLFADAPTEELLASATELEELGVFSQDLVKTIKQLRRELRDEPRPEPDLAAAASFEALCTYYLKTDWVELSRPFSSNDW